MMAAILHFRDLICWQKSLQLNKQIYQSTIKIQHYSLKGQIQSATLSIMNNIAEGFGRKSSKERIRFYEIASSSCYEVESMTYLIEELKLLEKEEILLLRNSTVEIYKMLAALSRSIKNQENLKRITDLES